MGHCKQRGRFYEIRPLILSLNRVNIKEKNYSYLYPKFHSALKFDSFDSNGFLPE